MKASNPSPNDFQNDDLLRDLEKKAEAVEPALHQSEPQAPGYAELRLKELAQRVRSIRGYFEKLKVNIEKVRPELYADYDVPMLGSIRRLKQNNYRLYGPEPADEADEFTFQYDYGEGQPFECRVEERAIAQQLKDSLSDYRVRFTTKPITTGGLIFKVEKRVPVSFNFAVSSEREQICLTLRNLERFGPRTNHFDLEDATPELARELAKCVLHKPNELDKLTGDALSNTGLIRIRDGLRVLEQQSAEPQVEDNAKKKRIWQIGRRS